jgi:hypothetical protein
VKYSKIEGTLAWSRGTILMRKGASFDEDHPLVAERPELFGDVDPGAEHKTREATPPPAVERATRAPGEVRNTPGTGPRGNRVPKVEGQ